MPHVLRALLALVSHVPRALRAHVPQLYCARSGLVPHALHALVLQLPRAPRVIMLHVPHILHALLLNTMVSNPY